MKYKRIVAALLQITLVTAAIAQQPSAETQEPMPTAETQEQQLSSSEESEARALAADFLARFEDTGDITSLMQTYTRDFSKRLRQSEEEGIAYPLATIDEPVMEQASDEDLLKCYSETINFLYLMARHYGAAAWLGKQSSINDDDETNDLSITETLPHEVIELLKGDSITRGFLRDQQRSSVREEPPAKPEEDGDTIKTLSRLRDYVRTLEKANGLLRTSAKSLLPAKTLMEALAEKSSVSQQSAAGEQSSDGDEASLKPRRYVLFEEWFGYPAGERFICIDMLIFHMDLVRVDRRLQVAALYLPMS